MRAPIKRGLAAATSIVAAIALSSCQEDKQAGIESSGGVNVVTGEGRSAHFDAVASHLHVGGEIFGYIDIDGDVEKLADMIQGFMKKVPAGEMPPHLEVLDLKKVLADLGLDGIEAMGMSSFKNGDLYHNRAFVYVPEGRKGLLEVFGGEAGPFVASSVAPSDADLVIEQTVNLAAAYEVVGKMILQFGGAGAYSEFRREMGEMNPQLGLSMADLFGKLDTRLTMIARVHPDKPLEIPDAPMAIPSFDFMIALDDLGWLYEKVTGNMKQEMPPEQAAQMFVAGDGFESIALPPMPSPDMAVMQPVIRNDADGKRLYLASSQAFLDECLSGKTKLADSEEFKLATADLPTEGNGLSYVSSGLMKAVRGIYNEVTSGKVGPVGAKEVAVMGSLLPMLLPDGDASQAKVIVNQEDGIFMSSNSSASMKQGALMGAGGFVASLGVFGFGGMSNRSYEVPSEVTPGSSSTIRFAEDPPPSALIGSEAVRATEEASDSHGNIGPRSESVLDSAIEESATDGHSDGHSDSDHGHSDSDHGHSDSDHGASDPAAGSVDQNTSDDSSEEAGADSTFSPGSP